MATKSRGAIVSIPLLLALWGSVAAHGADALSAIPTKDADAPPAVPAFCILTLRIEQVHWSLNPLTWLKDSSSASTLDIPTLPAYCSQLRVVSSDVRWGSDQLHGSTGDTQVWVERIQHSTDPAVPRP